MRLTAVFALLLATASARADEGMWTFDNFPTDKVKQRYGFAPDARWLEHVRLASVRLAGGCSGSFVSPQGLVLTNHHCAHGCVEQVSTPRRDLVKNGYYARTPGEELKCPAMEINQLVAITDVTGRMRQATRGLSDARFAEAQRIETAKIERECKTSPAVRCDVVELYHGGAHHLYRYRRFQDVRLVFVPEFATAFFGGDPDNFMFPRWDLDMALVRVYEGGKPLPTDHYFRWSRGGAKDGDLTFVPGNPGRTSRLLTIAELEYERDVTLTERLVRFAEWRGLLTEFSRRSAEHARISNHDLFMVENAFKARKGMFDTLADRRFFAGKVAEEKALRDAIARDPGRKQRYGGAFEAIAQAVERQRTLDPMYRWVKPHPRNPLSPRLFSTLLGQAEALWRSVAERGKPNEQRLKEFRDAALPRLTMALFSEAPIYDELEIRNLGFGLGKLREDLGPDHPFVKAVLGKEAPDELAARVVRGTRLKDVAERRRLWDGGKSAIHGSSDPLIDLARRMDAGARAARQAYEETVESVLRRHGERLAKLRFELYGTKTYPDATFSPRLSYGQVKGYTLRGQQVRSFTDFAGAFARDTGRPPFDLPRSWHLAKGKLNLRTPLNFCTDNDIIGGNSGSPAINREAAIVGLIFDGNLPHLAADYGFVGDTGRAVAVHSEAIMQALRLIYGAERVVKEILGR
ncbi:MAG: S46 family peptidase [Deltaproteobacteria bacterium]|nr:S46 family peptidase [Deltaproteobacteria bacterium]